MVCLPLLLGPGDGFGHSMGDGKMRSDGGGRMMHHGGPTNRHDDVPSTFHQEAPEFSNQRSDRFHYKSWDLNPEHVPKGRAYFEVRLMTTFTFYCLQHWILKLFLFQLIHFILKLYSEYLI